MGARPEGGSENYQAPVSSPAAGRATSADQPLVTAGRVPYLDPVLHEPVAYEVGLRKAAVRSGGVSELEESLHVRPDDLARVSGAVLGEAAQFEDE